VPALSVASDDELVAGLAGALSVVLGACAAQPTPSAIDAMVAVIVIALSARDRCELPILVDLVSSASSVVEA
jgi:hypothetical protein